MRVRKVFWLVVLLVLLFFARPLWEEKASEYVDVSFLESIDEMIEQVAGNPSITKAVDQAKEFTADLGRQLQTFVGQSSAEMPEQVDKPELEGTESLVAIHNITLGMSKEEAQAVIGLPLRLMRNEYGTDWHSYHQDYQNYMLLSYNDKGQVNGMFTNQDLISSTKGITMASNREAVRAAFGKPLKSLQKGNVQYILDTRNEYDMFKVNNLYITVFYDIHEENTVTAIQVIDEKLEAKRSGIYAEPDKELKEGYEFLLYELTNSARIQRELPLLKWDETARGTGRKHSQDMADNDYFSHTNLAGESPFDRMGDDGITFFVAGENLAYGQYNSIFAHEGLMNSAGHRENIVKRDFGYLGVGVAYNDENQPYYTENFFNR
ncbi:CAP-associated domain-containing protein [Planococcus sp. 107-1]|uniref:CAP domain-containing protein n=1 Tax=Planococcus sp. 107-1 TaxID=2908840 RepID=UPI001F1A6CB1|nr:CAP-associated domain-containing protein [Planococcus sp. 107-1]UJF27315.1 CAP domain-containing protein [Planococcus sp. 107-1]